MVKLDDRIQKINVKGNHSLLFYLVRSTHELAAPGGVSVILNTKILIKGRSQSSTLVPV